MLPSFLEAVTDESIRSFPSDGFRQSSVWVGPDELEADAGTVLLLEVPFPPQKVTFFWFVTDEKIVSWLLSRSVHQ